MEGDTFSNYKDINISFFQAFKAEVLNIELFININTNDEI